MRNLLNRLGRDRSTYNFLVVSRNLFKKEIEGIYAPAES